MKSYQTMYVDIQNQMFDTTNSGAGLLLTKQWINNSIHRRVNDQRSLVFLEKAGTIITQQAQQFYPLPNDYGKLIRISIAIGSTLYSPAEAPTKLFWDRLNYIGQANFQSQVPYFFYIQGSPGNQQIGIYPTPSTQNYTINFYYQSKPRALTQDDYTTGTIYNTTTVNAGTIVVNGITTTSAGATQISGTTTGAGAVAWNSSMVGDWIKLDEPTGDGFWYQIATATAPGTIVLTQPYQGATVVNGAVTYTIGEMSAIPEGYEDIIEEDVLARKYRQIQDHESAKEHQEMADMRFEELIADKSAKTVGPYSSPQVDLTIPNINSFPTNLTGF